MASSSNDNGTSSPSMASCGTSFPSMASCTSSSLMASSSNENGTSSPSMASCTSSLSMASLSNENGTSSPSMASCTSSLSMASLSNENGTSSPREKYPYPTEFNVLDFVPKLLSERNYENWFVPKLLSERNYENWKLLMRDFIRMRGLIGFIEGTAAKDSNRDEAWERSNNLVRGWILVTLSEDIRPRVLSSESAKGVWTRLEEIFDPTRSKRQPDEGMENRQGHYLALQKAAINGDWDKAGREIIERDPDAVRTHITPTLQTALHLAVSSGSKRRNRFVGKILEKMTPQDVVDLVNLQGMTALHYAAVVDNVEVAKMLVSKNSDLPNRSAGAGLLPIHFAAMYGFRKMVLYLKEVTSEDILLRDDDAGAYLFLLTRSEMYDEALTFLHGKPVLACMACMGFKESHPFDIIVEKHSSFPSGNSSNFWHNLVYLGAPVNHRNEGGRRGDIENPANCCISESYCAVWQRLHIMIWDVAEKLGAPVDHRNEGGRRGDIENPANCCISVWQRLHIMIWDVAGKLVLQMQREVQWFKEVEKFTLPGAKEIRNRDGMTPREIFSNTHQDLVKEGERWMKDTATSCTIVSALIATMVFAAAITVPGGNDEKTGIPLLSKRKAFVIFGISDAMALFSSITSVLTFLLILTSRYAEEEFLNTLPKRLITGLITLFVSILSTMVAFGAILYLVFGDNKAWILVPVVALASIPVILFGALQFPLLVEMIQSTYGRGIFVKQSDHVLR